MHEVKSHLPVNTKHVKKAEIHVAGLCGWIL